MQRIKETQATYRAATEFDGIFAEARRLLPLQKVHLVERMRSVMGKELADNHCGNCSQLGSTSYKS